jgi:hypothetical protein
MKIILKFKISAFEKIKARLHMLSGDERLDCPSFDQGKLLKPLTAESRPGNEPRVKHEAECDELDGFRPGGRIFYVPETEPRLARYVEITRIQALDRFPLLVLGEHIVITPSKIAGGKVAQDQVGSFWLSKEAYEAHLVPRSTRTPAMLQPAAHWRWRYGLFLIGLIALCMHSLSRW